jgi:hypothetical protein
MSTMSAGAILAAVTTVTAVQAKSPAAVNSMPPAITQDVKPKVLYPQSTQFHHHFTAMRQLPILEPSLKGKPPDGSPSLL